MAEPIPVERARRACERMLAICDGATPGPTRLIVRSPGNWAKQCWVSLKNLTLDMPTNDGQMLVAARATMRPLVAYVMFRLKYWDAPVSPRDSFYAPLAAIIQHLDSTEPGWETR